MEVEKVIAKNARRLREARRARLIAERGRFLAVELATRLEGELKEAAEVGMRAELARKLELKRRLLAVRKVTTDTQASLWTAPTTTRKPWARYGLAAALGLLLGTSVVAIAPFTAGASGPRDAVETAPLMRTDPGDGLKLSFSYSIQAPVHR